MNETRLLFFTDVHYRGNNPSGRKDDYPAAIRKKIEQIRDCGIEHEVDAYIDGGDTFDSFGPSNSVVYELIELYRTFPKPIYKVLGSHETVGYNYSPETRKRTAAGLLEIAEVVTMLGGSPKHVFGGSGGGVAVQLAGMHHQFNQYETHDFNPFRGRREPEGFARVGVVHGMLTKEPVPGPHTLVKDADVGPAHLVLSGHNHTPFRLKRGGVEFINPGSIARVENTEAERERIPQVVLVEAQEHLTLKTTLIKLDVERDVFFDRVDIVPANENMEEFFKRLESTVTKLERGNVQDTILAACDVMEVTERQKALAVEILEEVGS